MGVSKPFRRPGSLRWYVTVRPGDGRAFQRALKTRDLEKAERIRARIILELEEDAWEPPARTLTLAKFAEDYAETYALAAGVARRAARERSWRSDSSQLANVIEYLERRGIARVAAVAPKDALAYKEWRLTTGVSVETVKRAVRVAKAAWNWAIGHDFARAPNPWCGIRFPKSAPREPRNLSEFEIRKLLGVEFVGLDAVALPIAGVALYAGLRLGEIRFLEWPDLDAAAGVIRVRCDATFETKDREPRTTLYPAELRALVEPLRPDPAVDLVFPRADGLPRGEHQVERMFAKLVARAGIVNCTIHDLRRTFAGLLADRGVPSTRIRDYLGHASVATTESYYLGRNMRADATDGDKLTLRGAGAEPGAGAEGAAVS